MGYECPVCATPQADARHLADHMAFTAVVGDDDHEVWLDEHAPGWSEAGTAELAPRIAEHATERSFPQVFEDTVGGLEASDPADPPEERSGMLFEDDGHGHVGGHDRNHRTPHDTDRTGSAARDDRTARPAVDERDLDRETREVLEEARELTREMVERADCDGTNGDDEPDDEAA
jgi:hypothetical protein